MVCLGSKPGAAGWQAQTKPWRYGGHLVCLSLPTYLVGVSLSTFYLVPFLSSFNICSILFLFFLSIDFLPILFKSPLPTQWLLLGRVTNAHGTASNSLQVTNLQSMDCHRKEVARPGARFEWEVDGRSNMFYISLLPSLFFLGQYDQTWRNFATLAKFLKYLVIFTGLILHLADF